jgi:hypothetical protein
MSTRVTATARLDASCSHGLYEQFSLGVDPASELGRLNSIVGSHQLTLPDLRQLISTPSASSVLSALAPTEFGRVRAHVEGGSRSALEKTAADLQTELAETLTAAITVITAATRNITANTIADSGRNLGYAVTTHPDETATCVELRRGNEIVLVQVHDGGNLEFDHCGLTSDACGEQQLQLERAAKHHGLYIQRP